MKNQNTLNFIKYATALFAIICVQIGVSEYISVRCALFVIVWLTVLFLGRFKDWDVKACIALGLIVMFPRILWWLGSSSFQHVVLLSARECLCFLLIALALRGRFNIGWHSGVLWKCILYSAISLLILSIAQRFYISGISPFKAFLPSEWFGREDRALIGDIIARAVDEGYASTYRPCATFSEPSYLGFICVSLYVSGHSDSEILKNVLLCGVSLLTLVVSNTASGILVLLSIFALFNFRNFRGLKWMPILVLFGVVIVGALSSNSLRRVVNSFDESKEASGYIRLVYPVKLLSHSIFDYPLGLPYSELREYGLKLDRAGEVQILEDGSVQMDNALLGTFVFYGFLSPLLWSLLAREAISFRVVCYIVFITVFNGDLFSFDKAAIIALVSICRERTEFFGKIINSKGIQVPLEARQQMSSEAYGSPRSAST